MSRLLSLAFCCAGCLFAAEPRPKPTDYPSSAASPGVAIGAEYLVHSISNGSQMYVATEYLVVDTAIYPHGELDVKLTQFSLRLILEGKGKQGKGKQSDETVVLNPEAPQMVAYSIAGSLTSLPEMSSSRGRRQPMPRPMPSDQGTTQDSNANGPETISDVITRMALHEDVIHSGEAGYLYFAFSGKTKRIKALDLVYGTGDTALVVKLF